MKKVISGLVVGLAALMMVAGTSFATPAMGTGDVDVDAKTGGYGVSFDGEVLPNWHGASGGIGVATGGAMSGAKGGVINGKVGADVWATGGGLTRTESFSGPIHANGVNGKYVGSQTDNEAHAGAGIEVGVNPDKWGVGAVAGGFIGGTGQASLDASFIKTDERSISDGVTGGIVGQGSIGGFAGGVTAFSGPDYKKYIFCGPTVDSKASAGANANLDLYGGSYSVSEITVKKFDGYTTEAMRTDVGAYTEAYMNGGSESGKKGYLAGATDFVSGGFIAGGGAKTATCQTTDTGVAKATAVGTYAGSGGLNGSYIGNADGYSSTSATTRSGWNGSIMSASAGMTVQSTVTGSNQP
jgi:hypothetical protein